MNETTNPIVTQLREFLDEAERVTKASTSLEKMTLITKVMPIMVHMESKQPFPAECFDILTNEEKEAAITALMANVMGVLKVD